VDLAEHKDANGLYLSGREAFKDRLISALKEAESWKERQGAEIEAQSRRAWAGCKDLVLVPNILERFACDLARSGVAGESRVAKLLYLAVTSRFLERPVSVAVKGPSSGGKSYLTERVLGFFPESSYYALTAMSEHALAYSDEPLMHRFLVIYEAAGMNSDFQTYLIRSLLSEGKVRYETVEKTSEGMKPRLIERAGPTGLIITTTLTRLHPENETRMLSLLVTDTRQQTSDIMAALASEASADPPDFHAWHSLQEWLAAAEHRVAVPYAEELAAVIPPIAVRLRRDFGALLNLIRAHAILHQASRERTKDGRIVATLEDYARVRELVADLVSEGIEATVPATVRETVEMVKRLREETEKDVTIAALADELKLDKSAAWRRVRSAMDRGYLENLEDRKGRPAKLAAGDDLPDDIEILPTPERLQGCTVASDSEGIETNNLSKAAGGAREKEFLLTPSDTAATVQPREEIIL
jgi:urease gamma subunit